MLFHFREIDSQQTTTHKTNMAMNMNNTQMCTLVQECYETDGLSRVQDLLVEMKSLSKEYSEIDNKRKTAEAKKLAAAEKKALKPTKAEKNWSKLFSKQTSSSVRKSKMLWSLMKTLVKNKKARIYQAHMVPTKNWQRLFGKQYKVSEKNTKKAASQLKSLVKLKKTSLTDPEKVFKSPEAVAYFKDIKIQTKRWGKMITKSIKHCESDTTKALKQLKKLVKLKKAADAKKGKKKTADTAASDDLISTLMANAPAPVAHASDRVATVYSMEELFGSDIEDEDDETHVATAAAEGWSKSLSSFEWNGVKYIRDSKGILYDPETHDEIAFWNEAEQTVGDALDIAGPNWYSVNVAE